VVARQALDGNFKHVLATNSPAEGNFLQSAKGGNSFPLWLYPEDQPTDLLDTVSHERRANLAPEFVAALAEAVGETPSPEDTLAWIYAILYAPSYRARYADFLRRDFPRVPLPPSRDLFKRLVAIGRELIALHTMEAAPPRITGFPVPGSNEVTKPRWAPDAVNAAGRVYINAEQYFDKLPTAVWDMHIGGYRVAEKWLKDRKGRTLSYDDLTHYQAMIAALARTLELQQALDAAIDAAGGWPFGDLPAATK
jgi:predicted helicase